jgi:hypothetical protein
VVVLAHLARAVSQIYGARLLPGNTSHTEWMCTAEC